MPIFLVPLVKFVAPYFSKVGIAIIGVLGVLILLWYLDPYRAKYQAEAAQVRADAQASQIIAAQNKVVVTQLTSEIASAQAAAARVSSIKRSISLAPRTSSCASSPAFRALLDGLRGGTSDAAPASANSSGGP